MINLAVKFVIIEKVGRKCDHMNILNSFKNLINQVEELDKKSKKMSKEKCYSSNPFAFQGNKTYVWVEKLKGLDDCGRKKTDW
jgi:hypothetical protein